MRKVLSLDRRSFFGAARSVAAGPLGLLAFPERAQTMTQVAQQTEGSAAAFARSLS